MEQSSGQGRFLSIRDSNDSLIGGVSADDLQVGTTHRAEIGYWVGVMFWGQGIMTDY